MGSYLGRSGGSRLIVPAAMVVTAIIGLATVRAERRVCAQSAARHSSRQVTALVRDYLGAVGALDRAITITLEREAIPRIHRLPVSIWTAECTQVTARARRASGSTRTTLT